MVRNKNMYINLGVKLLGENYYFRSREEKFIVEKGL